MKFTSIFALALTALPVFGAAVPAEENALESRAVNGAVVLSKSVNTVKAAVDALDKVVLTIVDQPNIDIIGLAQNSTFLLDTLTNQTAVAKKAPKLDEQCADYVQYFVVKLIKSVQKLAKDLISKKQFIIPAGLAGPLLDFVSLQKDAADLFADTLITKVPASRKALAQKDKKQVDDAINKILKTFNVTST